jgi:hypothetical protein
MIAFGTRRAYAHRLLGDTQRIDQPGLSLDFVHRLRHSVQEPGAPDQAFQNVYGTRLHHDVGQQQ